jgi:hypothetical protein
MTVKVRIFCWWTTSEAITERVKNQFMVNTTDYTNIEFVYDDSYNWAVVFGKLENNNIITPPDRTIFFAMEPSWSINTDRHATEYSNYVFAPTGDIFATNKHYVHEYPTFMLYGGRGDSEWTVHDMASWDLSKSLTCSMVVTKTGDYQWWVPANSPTLYADRVAAAELMLLHNLGVHVFGNGWESTGDCKGEVWNKKIALTPYKFSVALENSHEKNYISEKFIDCLLTNTIPIYFGCTNISNYYDPQGYLQLSDIKNLDEILYVMRDITRNHEKMYKMMLPHSVENKQIFFERHNLLHKINQIVMG